jgi:rfaE bifunctional protein nucleotidyltransferase chain/domain
MGLVFANGVFDLLHPGHVYLLGEAAKLGYPLVVGVNDDASVYRLKGAGRPVQDAFTRMRAVAALPGVRQVRLFGSEAALLDLIQELRPAVLVKGGDHELSHVRGRELLESWAGRVVVVPRLPGYSTTARVRAGLGGAPAATARRVASA